MILFTLGTNEQPFDRLARAAAALETDEDLIVQHGSSAVRGRHGTWVDYVPFDTLMTWTREARIIVCHAGVGSIMLARRVGRRPLVVPRRHRLGEAVDDHQVLLAQRLDRVGAVVAVEDVAALAAAVHGMSGMGVATTVADGLRGADALSADVLATLSALGAARRLGHAA